ncbi:putative cis-zeatin O-glucosyltransferase [Phragmites australis]|uniref:putative cis-zeatin O-glucosyltransferase n=1 Tax=Phragmites australis TaxID=29695 RepID=UPI002D7882F8|nr:putative cis-zeatin O-glucosyltransferase [Phragmites australis]
MDQSVAVVAVPFPAQGHLNQLLHLSLQLASRGLPVHYAAPAEHVRQARARVHDWGDDALRRIQFHELAISEYASPPPDPAADSPFPCHLMSMWEAFIADAPAPLAALLGEISASNRRVVVLYDIMNAFAAEEATRLPNGEGFGFHCTAASSIVGRMDGGTQLLRNKHGLDYLPVHAFVPEEFLEFVGNRARAPQTIPSSAGILMNTCRALEGEFIDLVAEQLAAAGKKVFSIGPLNPLLDASAPEQGKERHECLDWLDKQPPASVLYVSFGSMSSLRGEQVAELAAALRDSNQRFIWVLRDADRSNVFADSGESRHSTFLSEFTKETEGTGLVITGWAPQLEILAHGATAAFMSHCGWNSTMESMSHGKPILAWPMHSDQPWDAELLCKYLKVGFLVRPCEKHSEVIPAETIREVIKKMMVSDEGLVVRRRAMALGEAVRASTAEGGSSRKDLEEFIAHITM